MSKQNISRRTVLKGTAAAAGVAVGSGAVSGFPTIWAQNLKDVTLRSIGSAVTHVEPWAKQATEDLGFKVEITALDFDSITNRIITQPGSFDIAEPTFNTLRRLSPVGNTQPIDTKRLGQDQRSLSHGSIDSRFTVWRRSEPDHRHVHQGRQELRKAG